MHSRLWIFQLYNEQSTERWDRISDDAPASYLAISKIYLRDISNHGNLELKEGWWWGGWGHFGHGASIKFCGCWQAQIAVVKQKKTCVNSREARRHAKDFRSGDPFIGFCDGATNFVPTLGSNESILRFNSIAPRGEGEVSVGEHPKNRVHEVHPVKFSSNFWKIFYLTEFVKCQFSDSPSILTYYAIFERSLHIVLLRFERKQITQEVCRRLHNVAQHGTMTLNDPQGF